MRPLLLGLLACALAFGGLWAVRRCNLEPCTRPSLEHPCSMVLVTGPCPVDSLDAVAGVAVGGAIAVWTYVRRREHA